MKRGRRAENSILLYWHTDKSFRPAPSMATVLHAIEMPPIGGDTCFANMYCAYEALSVKE